MKKYCIYLYYSLKEIILRHLSLKEKDDCVQILAYIIQHRYATNLKFKNINIFLSQYKNKKMLSSLKFNMKQLRGK